nr:hypothetical protein [Angustibacter aerolatus]
MALATPARARLSCAHERHHHVAERADPEGERRRAGTPAGHRGAGAALARACTPDAPPPSRPASAAPCRSTSSARAAAWSSTSTATRWSTSARASRW